MEYTVELLAISTFIVTLMGAVIIAVFCSILGGYLYKWRKEKLIIDELSRVGNYYGLDIQHIPRLLEEMIEEKRNDAEQNNNAPAPDKRLRHVEVFGDKKYAE